MLKRFRRRYELKAEAIKNLLNLQKAYPNDEIGKAVGEILFDLGYGRVHTNSNLNANTNDDIISLLFFVLSVIMLAVLYILRLCLFLRSKYRNIQNLAVILSTRFPSCKADIAKCLDDYHACCSGESAKICRLLAIIAVVNATDHVRFQGLNTASN